MEALWSWIQLNVISWLVPPKNIEIIDIVQVAIIAYVVYRLIMWFKNTRAYSLAKGILIIAAFLIVARIFNMTTIIWLLENLGVVAITALVIIFQPELRKVLEQMGHRNFLTSFFAFGHFDRNEKRFSDQTINEIVGATAEMAENMTGALIIVELNFKLDDVIATGISLNSEISRELLTNIFEHNTPLHDGAVIIRGDKIMAATCYLPLSENMTLSKSLGTRHRAGVGISETADCLAIIVSEETGKISYAIEGRLFSGVTATEIREILHEIQNNENIVKLLARKESLSLEEKSFE